MSIRFHVFGPVKNRARTPKKCQFNGNIYDAWTEYFDNNAPQYWYRIKILGIPTPFIRLIP